MSDHTIELFILKCAVIESRLREDLEEHNPSAMRRGITFIDQRMEPFIRQFALANRNNAAKMSMYYEVFYMLENDIRRFIIDTMAAHGPGGIHMSLKALVKRCGKTATEKIKMLGQCGRTR